MVDAKLEFEAKKHQEGALGYLDNPKRTEGLLKKAILKARNNKGTLGEAWGKLQLFFDLVQAYSKGEYRNVSPATILTIIGAILYFVSPLDVVPDFLVGLGILDDAAVISFTLKKLSVEIEAFKIWKRTTTKSPLD
ncbi:YkvA family protein [Neobacillus niacini]|uniref:YkvA family protein n=1 Tax=Neobacillus niacini TaxID=86668 RepID=UPI00203E3DFC|nr:YkvA family protein [Neobacillus niacini]MCM3690110.1 YkvA family protein [Neobacillus niacini]